MQRLVAERPVVLAVGTRLATANLPEGHRVVQIDVDPEEIGRNYKDTLPVLGDRGGVAGAAARGGLGVGRAERESGRLSARTSASAATHPAGLMEPQASFTRAIRAALPDDGILISGMTQIGYFSRAYYPVYKPGTYITSSYSGNLGFAFPTALGAKVARPDTPVVCVSGDGGFMYNVQELATAVQYGINTGDRRVQRQRVWQCAAGAGAAVQRPPHRREPAQPRLRADGRVLRRAGASGARRRRAGGGAAGVLRRGRADAH